MKHIDNLKMIELLFQFAVICLVVLLAEFLLGLFRYLLWRRGRLSFKELYAMLVSGQSGSQGVILKEIREIRKGQEDLLHRLEQLTGESGAGRESVGGMQDAVAIDDDGAPPLEEQSQKEISSRSESKEELPWSAVLESISQLYNAGITDPSLRQALRDRYELIRIGPVNLMERRRDPSVDPIFKTASDGDYYAVPLDGADSGSYAVVPRFDLVFQESSYGPGAMNRVFDCQGFNPQKRYSQVKVIWPALFRPDAGETWILNQRGKLNLGQGE